MKKLMTLAAVAVSVSMIAGCLTRTLAQTKTTKPDGTVTESLVSVIGIGDKASEVASKGLFADGTPETLGAGVADAKASQQSTGIKETMEGVDGLLCLGDLFVVPRQSEHGHEGHQYASEGKFEVGHWASMQRLYRSCARSHTPRQRLSGSLQSLPAARRESRLRYASQDAT